MTYALDSNIISYMLRDDDTVYSRYDDAVTGGDKCVIPLIVYYEVRRGLISHLSFKKMMVFEKLCADLDIVLLNLYDIDAAAEIYADLRRAGSPIDDADLLIAAQAAANGYTLVTHNTRHFDGVAGLATEDWTIRSSHT